MRGVKTNSGDRGGGRDIKTVQRANAELKITVGAQNSQGVDTEEKGAEREEGSLKDRSTVEKPL